MQFFHDTHFDFIGKRKTWYMVSLIVSLLGIVVILVRGVQFGIDFEGGTEAAFEFAQPVQIDAVRTAIEGAGFDGAEIKSYGGDNQVLIRVKSDHASDQVTGETVKLSDVLMEHLQKAFPENAVILLKADNIGPKIGKELRLQALYAVLASIVAILIYVTFRFEFVYALGAIIALVHDVWFAFTCAVLLNGVFGLNLEMNQGMLAALLTVVGFSINDTVVIFDRIRENKTLHRGENLLMLMNRSINEVLPRTFNTSLTVALVLFILLIFSGEVLRGFAFTMLVGVLVGIYSTIFIASSFVVTRMIQTGKLDPKADSDFAEHHAKIRTAARAAARV